MNQMSDMIDLLRETYRLRDSAQIGYLAEWLDEDSVIIGTSLGEMSRGKAGFSALLESDLKYWVDIDIAQEYTQQTVGDCVLYTLPAIALCRFTVNDTCYERYVGYMNDVLQSPMPDYAKAVKAIWTLDHLIASKPGVRHLDKRPLTIELLTRNDKIRLISFSHPYRKNHVDCFTGEQEDMDTRFARDMASLRPDAALREMLMASAQPDGQRFCDAAAERHGDWFVGCGYLQNDEPMDDEIRKDFEALDEESTPYRKLYTLRKRLGETLWLYAHPSPQKIMVRFYGVLRDDRIVFMRHSYPFYWIRED